MKKIEAYKMARRKRAAEEIAAALKASGLSQKEFAIKMGRVPSEVTKWLSGRHNFTSDLLEEISVALSVPISGAEDSVRYIDTTSVVRGYGDSNETGSLNDSVSAVVSNVIIPADITEALTDEAKSKGMSLREYILDILSASVKKHKVTVEDFAGIWDDSFPTAEELRSMRTNNTLLEL